MTDNTKGLDIVQRIAEVITRTSEPQPSASGSMKDGSKVIGSVPVHLRHLHNLLDELSNEAIEAERIFRDKHERMTVVRNLFFNALKTQVPTPEDASGLTILENWDVIANYQSNGDDDEMGGLGKLLVMAGIR